MLDHAKIRHVGAGANPAAVRPEKIFKKDLRITVLGLTDNESGWHATDTTPGTNYIAIGDNIAINGIEALKERIAALKLDTNLLIVSIHWVPICGSGPIKLLLILTMELFSTYCQFQPGEF